MNSTKMVPGNNLKPQIHPIGPFRLTVKSIEQQILHDHWCVVSYLIINQDISELANLVERELPENFAATMAIFIHGYMYENKMPPTEIAQTILNVTEDMVAGRQVILRAGDYIAVQKYMRAKK
jgi:hypothetical protein